MNLQEKLSALLKEWKERSTWQVYDAGSDNSVYTATLEECIRDLEKILGDNV